MLFSTVALSWKWFRHFHRLVTLTVDSLFKFCSFPLRCYAVRIPFSRLSLANLYGPLGRIGRSIKIGTAVSIKRHLHTKWRFSIPLWTLRPACLFVYTYLRHVFYFAALWLVASYWRWPADTHMGTEQNSRCKNLWSSHFCKTFSQKHPLGDVLLVKLHLTPQRYTENWAFDGSLAPFNWHLRAVW